ncbi:hypothetical protein B5180_01685 [Streptomyces sp. BF-3]|nr:hypothetical protein B5180_01685 [Streptomyces sp. BF-3]
MSEFKVGDWAIRNGREVEVTYGPFISPSGFAWAVVRREDGREDTVRVMDLSPVPVKFAVGDKIRHDNLLAEIIGGPVVGAISGEEIVLFKYLEGFLAGKGMSSKVSKVEPVTKSALVPVGTRVRIDRATYGEYVHGMIGVVTSNAETFRSHEGDLHPYRVELGGEEGDVYAAEVTPVDQPADGFEYEGAFYERRSTYRDKDGDFWEFARPDEATDETSEMRHVDPRGEHGDFRYDDESLLSVLMAYGPLTKQ